MAKDDVEEMTTEQMYHELKTTFLHAGFHKHANGTVSVADATTVYGGGDTKNDAIRDAYAKQLAKTQVQNTPPPQEVQGVVDALQGPDAIDQDCVFVPSPAAASEGNGSTIKASS